MSTVNKYKIYCVEEGMYISGWSTEEPTKCYNNDTHEVNGSSVQLLETISQNMMSIKEDKIDIDRNIWIKDISILDVAPDTTKTVDYVFPFPTSLYSFSFSINSTNTNDNFSMIANPDMVMGLLVSNINVGATSLYAPPTLTENVTPGFYLSIADGTNTNDLGLITAIDKNTGLVNFQTPATKSFSATNAMLKTTIKVFNNARLGGAGVYKFFDDTIGGSPLMTGTLARFIYKNNSPILTGTTKSFTVYLTCLF